MKKMNFDLIGTLNLFKIIGI